MAIITVELTFSSVNVSAQIGDTVYYTYTSVPSGGFNNSNVTDTIMLGKIISIKPGGLVTVTYDSSTTSAPPINSFISFAKDKSINTSSILGYYAEVKFVNNSRDKVELFSVGSQVSESSK